MSQSTSIGLAYIKACMDLVTRNLRVLTLEAAIKSDLHDAQIISDEENSLQQEF